MCERVKIYSMGMVIINSVPCPNCEFASVIMLRCQKGHAYPEGSRWSCTPPCRKRHVAQGADPKTPSFWVSPDSCLPSPAPYDVEGFT